MAERFVLSDFGTIYLMTGYTDSNTVPETLTNAAELDGVLSCSPVGAVTKSNATYKVLNGDGWDSIATLGNSQDDLTLECIRTGTAGVYDGTDGTSTYTRIKNWFMNATQNAGVQSPKCLIELLPRGGASGTASEYEATLVYVVPNSWNPGDRNTDSGQEFSFTVTPFGPVVPLSVVKSVEGSVTTYTFTKVSIQPTA